MKDFNNLNEKIIKNFSNKLKSPSTLTKAIKECDNELKNELNDFLNEHPEYEKISLLICAFCKNLHPKKCKTCGNQMTYSKSVNHDFCCKKCVQINENIRTKIEKTCFEKYGVKSPTLNENVLKQRDKNNFEKYGTSNLRNVKEIDDKIKKTCLEKYGYETPSKNKQIKEKSKQTCLEKYGVEWTGQSIQKLERTKETFIKNYDVDHPMKTNTVIQKMKNTFKEKYGNENIVNVPKIKEKIKISRLNSTYESILIRFKDYVIPSFSKNEFKGVGYYDVKYKWKCVKCGNEFFDTCYSNIPRCEKCYPKKQSSSLSEMKFIEFIKSLTTLKIETSNRSLISPLELDVVIPEKKLAFEFNGIYWHSDKFIKTRDYHLNKTMMCEKIGYKLIHIWEYHWDHKQDILKDKLKSIFNIFDKKISAHKCNVEKLTENEKIIFLNTNSLNGNDKSDILYGLKYNDEIVSIMTLTKLIENNYEIVSYCSKLGHKIFGGGTKLLKYFENEYRPQSIVTKCDISYNFTTFYEKLGFHLKEKTQPNHHLIKDQIIFEDDLKNKNLINNELLKIWDCGNFIYEKTY